MSNAYYTRWAYGRLADLSGPLVAQFDRTCSTAATLLDTTTGKRAFYVLPMKYDTSHIHLWRSLLERCRGASPIHRLSSPTINIGV